MTLTSGADSGKTVVYTDRELSRPLLEHFGDQEVVVYTLSRADAVLDYDMLPGTVTGSIGGTTDIVRSSRLPRDLDKKLLYDNTKLPRADE